MTPVAARTTARWLLLGAVVIGLIGMHHTVWHTGSHATAAPHATHVTAHATEDCCPSVAGQLPPASPMPDGLTHLLHLCLAVLCALVALALGYAVYRRRWWTPGRRARPTDPIAPRIDEPPPRFAQPRVLSLCVLRL
jgi:hypothetical protein